MIALLNSGHNPDSWKIRGALRYLCDAYAPQRGWPPNPNEEPQVWTTYYAVQALQAYINAMKNLTA
jgi:hypothetical protein